MFARARVRQPITRGSQRRPKSCGWCWQSTRRKDGAATPLPACGTNTGSRRERQRHAGSGRRCGECCAILPIAEKPVMARRSCARGSASPDRCDNQTESSVETVANHERPRQEWIEVPVPPLVSEEVFALAQEPLQKNAPPSPRRTREPTLLPGMLLCQQCGYAL